MKYSLNHMNRCAQYVITCLWIMCLAIMAGSAAVKADSAATLERDGRSYAMLLPKGYCDITTRHWVCCCINSWLM